MSTEDLAWVPQSCTLPTADRPLRVAEFDDLFAESVRGIERRDPTRLTLTLESDPGVAARTAELAARESQCRSFFTFALTASRGELRLDVSVPDTDVDVLDAIAARLTR